MIPRIFQKLLMTVGVTMALVLPAGAMTLEQLDEAMQRHPAADQLKQLFPQPAAALPEDFAPTGLTKKDYLRLVAGNVDFWKQHQDDAGAILDFNEANEKHPKGQERQYSTPAFALAAAMLVQEAGRDDLLDPAVRAFEFSLTALVNKTTANQHADFYIPMQVHAHRILKTRVPAERAAKWEKLFRQIVPEEHYRDTTAGANWNIVNVAGEALRRKDGLVDPARAAAQQQYLDAMLQKQQRRFTKFGMYEDPNAPLSYDAFPRLWLEDVTADGAYNGPARAAVEQFLVTGGFSSLLLMSPSGEWPSGGRSAHHQWNEAENAVIGEINAARWKAAGRDDIAGAYKRLARMGLKSMLRWQRPSGEMWIVKNFADPKARLGYEGYSFHSQYNLLPMAMLCIAYLRADDAIEERPLPAEYGSYVFDVRETFHQVIAASGGYYVQINTAADPHYNATGLQRVHRRGIELSPLSDSAAGARSYHAGKDDPKVALAPGMQWKTGEEWVGLMHFHRPPTKSPQRPQRVIQQAGLEVGMAPDRVSLTIAYELDGPDARDVEERYVLSGDGVRYTQVLGESQAAPHRAVFPVLVNDGARETQVEVLQGEALQITRGGGVLRLESLDKNPPKLQLDGPRIPTHNGYVRAAVAPATGQEVNWRITLEPAPLTSQ